ncbi:MAG: hypothetical protein E7Z87_04595 [Cyanobacteria bacterium SIG26]|nr:hypothetical protein [Cyanobacteria bacterium SIG26]
MINKVELGSVNSKYKTPEKFSIMKTKRDLSFNGLGDLALRSIQACEQNPMVNVTVLDLATAIIPRTFFETFIGSKQKDENGNETGERKLNLHGGFEALRREGSGLVINCLIPSFIVMGAAKLFNRPVMGAFNKSNLTNSWANGESINKIQQYYTAAEGATKEDKMFNTLKSMIHDIEGVNGDIQKDGLKKFKDILLDDNEFDKQLKAMAQNIVSEKPNKEVTKNFYIYLVNKTGISENIRFVGEKGFSTSNLSHICNSASEILHGVIKEGTNIKNADDLAKYFTKAKKLVNVKSIAGLGAIIPLAIAAQPINRWITHKMSGKKGAPIYNDDQERVLTPDDKKKLTAQKFFAVPLMWGVAGLSMLMDRPSLKMFQFKGIFPTMDQARIISAATFSSRLAASEDSNELKESTIRDIATFSSFYFLGDYAAKGIATYLEKHNKDGIKLTNKLATKDGTNALENFWNWAKHTKMKSTEELEAIADIAKRSKAKNLRAVCQLGNLAFSLASLGVFIPLYTRTQTNKKKQNQEIAKANNTQNFAGSFTQKLIKEQSPTFKSFFS